MRPPHDSSPAVENMEPPDRQGQHVRHCKTHRNAFVQELGPQKMLVYCPDTNIMEHRWKTAFYKVPASHISVAVDDQNQLRVTTEVNGNTTTEDAYYWTEEDGPGFIWCESWKMAGFGGLRLWQLKNEDDGKMLEV